MSKPHYPFLIVVEGATDKAFLLSFLDAEIVITNGSEVSRGTIEYVKEAIKTRDVVVLTDPDSPGKKIRDTLDQNVPGLLHAFVPKEVSIKHHKVGVAESTKDAVLEALDHLTPSKTTKKGNLTMSDFLDLGLMGGPQAAEKRNLLSKKYHLGFGNAKTLLQRANAVGLSKEELEEAIHE